MTNPLSSHGTMVAFEFDPEGAPAVFTDIAELGDLTLPELMRNEFDASVHNRDIDSYVMGILRRGEFSYPIQWIPDNATHDHQTGVYKLLIDKTLCGVRVRIPLESGSLDWVASGHVKGIAPTAPVDGKLTANVKVRFSGRMKIGDVFIGSDS